MHARALTIIAVLAGSIAAVMAAPGKTPAPKPDKLAVTAIEPNVGDPEGGTYVRITGNRFIDDGPRQAKVYFGAHQGTVVRFVSDTEMIVEAPGGKVNDKVDVLVVFEPGGEQKLVGAFTFAKKH